MSKTWRVQEEKARFSEFLEASAWEGPQIVTKRGVEAAVLLLIEQWRRPREIARPDLQELLLATEVRTDMLAPPRGAAGARPSNRPQCICIVTPPSQAHKRVWSGSR